MRSFCKKWKKSRYSLLTAGVLLSLGISSSALAAEQTDTEFNKGRIDGGFAFGGSSDFTKYKVWDNSRKTYEFGKDSILNVKSITGEKNLIRLNAPDVTLTLNSKDEFGVQSYCGRHFKAGHNYKKVKDVNITVKKLILNVDSTKMSGGGKETFGIVCASDQTKNATVTVNGDVDINVKSKYYKDPDATGEVDPTFTNGIATTHHGNVVINGNAKIHVRVPEQAAASEHRPPAFLRHYYVNGIFAGLNYDNDKAGSRVTINGDADVDVDGTGVHAGGRSLITIKGGGVIRTQKDDNLPHFSLNAEEGVIHMNVRLDAAGNVIGAGDRSTKIYGNIGLIDREEDTGKITGTSPTTINLGLTTADSVFHGVVLDDFKEHGKNEPGKKAIRENTGLRMYLQNGAEWHNATWGAMLPETPWRGVTHKFTGSKVLSLMGGATPEAAGRIFQEDERPIQVEKYSGYTQVLYKHDAADPTKIQGGDVVIKKAAAGSGITLRTDAAGLDTSSGAPEDKNKVNAALHALAQKLFYSAYKDGEENLKGKVEIAEGLTTPSAALRTESMTYKRENGQGQYAYQELPPSVTYGPSETVIMRETKTALTAGALAWRNNNNDLARRMGELRLKNAERGAWVKYLGGKTFMNDQGVDMSQSYGIVQVGYDRDVKDWTVGALVDYGKMKSSSAGSSADDRLVGLAVYGVKQQKDGSYLDLIVRANRLSGDFTVRNSAVELQGDHKNFGISASAEYGKRFAQPGGFYIEPSAELTLGHLQGDDSTARNGSNILHVRQDAFNSAVGKLGLGIGQETKASNVFLKLGLAHEFAGDLDVRYHEPGYTPKSTHVSLKDTWMELEAGGSVLLSDRAYAYTGYTRSFRTDVHDHWRVDAGVRFSF